MPHLPQVVADVVALTPARFQAWLSGPQPTPDSSSVPNSSGASANNGLPPAYPQGSSAGSVVYPTPGDNGQPTKSTTTSTTPATSGSAATTTTVVPSATSTLPTSTGSSK